ncbi:MAG: glycosyltransferase family 4 protein [Thermoanaerobaculia bacterium]|nr:glycosyltransferase family 4 protein [Thermoanaerobaculia bacterium]
MTSRTRVLYVERPQHGGGIGGATLSLVELVKRLPPDFEPRVLLFHRHRGADLLREAGATVTVLDRWQPAGRPLPRPATVSRSLARAAFTIARVLRESPLALIVKRRVQEEGIALIHHNNKLETAYPALLAGRWAGVPQVCHLRSLTPPATLEAVVARLADAFIYNSRATESIHLAAGVPRARGRVVYNPFDLTGLARRRDRRQLRAQLGIAPEAVVVANIGRLVEWKGQDVFLEALARLPGSLRPLALVVGAPEDQAGVAFERRLREQVVERGLGDRVLFSGFVDDVGAVLAACDLVVHSAKQAEPFGRVIVEAMAAGRPVIATGDGGVPEIVENRTTGLLVAPGDAGAMASAMQHLITHPHEAATMARRGQQSVRRFSAEAHVDAVVGIYRQLLGQRREGAAGEPEA